MEIGERILEYGVRRGLLDALHLSYQPANDGSLIIHVPRHRGHFRIEPPGVGAASAVRVIALGDDGRTQVGILILALRWDASATDWALAQASESGEVAAEAWKAMLQLASQAGWLLPRAA
jgi:hypothetical protein